MSLSNPIVKLTYKHEFFDISAMRNGARIVTTIFEDGRIMEQHYELGSRKVCAKRKALCSIADYQALCDRLEACIDTANDCDMWVDDCLEELKLVYKFNRVQTVDRGLCNGELSIGGVMREFLGTVCFE